MGKRLADIVLRDHQLENDAPKVIYDRCSNKKLNRMWKFYEKYIERKINMFVIYIS